MNGAAYRRPAAVYTPISETFELSETKAGVSPRRAVNRYSRRMPTSSRTGSPPKASPQALPRPRSAGESVRSGSCGGCSRRSVVGLTHEITLNIVPGEQLVGIEVLDAKKTLGKGDCRRWSWTT